MTPPTSEREPINAAQLAGIRDYVKRNTFNGCDSTVILYEESMHGTNRVRVGDLLAAYDAMQADRDAMREQRDKVLRAYEVLDARWSKDYDEEREARLTAELERDAAVRATETLGLRLAEQSANLAASEPVAWAVYRDEQTKPWDVVCTQYAAVYSAAVDDRIVPLYAHPSAAAEAVAVAAQAVVTAYNNHEADEVKDAAWVTLCQRLATTHQDSVDDDYGPNDGEARTVNRSRPTPEGDRDV